MGFLIKIAIPRIPEDIQQMQSKSSIRKSREGVKQVYM